MTPLSQNRLSPPQPSSGPLVPPVSVGDWTRQFTCPSDSPPKLLHQTVGGIPKDVSPLKVIVRVTQIGVQASRLNSMPFVLTVCVSSRPSLWLDAVVGVMMSFDLKDSSAEGHCGSLSSDARSAQGICCALLPSLVVTVWNAQVRAICCWSPMALSTAEFLRRLVLPIRQVT